MLFIWIGAWVALGFVLWKTSENKLIAIGGGFIGSLLVLIMVNSALTGGEDTKAPPPEPKPMTREDRIKKHFSAWDGSHRNLTRYIKDRMNDPDSYEHVETRYIDLGDKLKVITKFRGENAFGGTVINTVVATVSMSGEILSAETRR